MQLVALRHAQAGQNILGDDNAGRVADFDEFALAVHTKVITIITGNGNLTMQPPVQRRASALTPTP